MANPNILNVYSGPDALKKYLNPDFQPPLPLVEVPEALNPFYEHGVRIYAKMMTMHPANNVKAVPAMNMLESSVLPGKTKTIIEYSSGSTVISMAMIARICHNISDVRAYLSNKTSHAKLRLMQFFGLDITLFGGPSQPDPHDERGGIQSARRMAIVSDEIVNPNQYPNDNNWKAHVRWTGPQILNQLPEINVICAGMGTSGTMTGIGTYFKQARPSVFRLGVCTAPGDRVPGPRSHALLEPVQFPWKEAVDAIEEVGSPEAYSLSLDLCRQGLVCGPSSGFNLSGLVQMLDKRKSAGTLQDLAGPDGLIRCVFLCCDLPYQYIDEYFQKLGSEKFHPIHNQNLVKADTYRYDESWERHPSDILPHFYEPPDAVNVYCWAAIKSKPKTYIVDLGKKADYETEPSPFANAKVLEAQWLELEDIFGQVNHSSNFNERRVLVLCYNGDTARVATSILRAKAVAADCVCGGYQAINAIALGGFLGERESRLSSPRQDILV